MSSVYFALTRHEYGSYVDLRTLIALSGYPACYLDEIDPQSDNTYLIIIPGRKGLLPDEGYPGAKARLIQWAFEWDPYEPMPGISEVWYPDVWAAREYGGRYVPIGGDANLRGFATVPNNAPQYDAAFLAYMTGNRPEVRKAMMDKGVSVSPTSAWGDERHIILEQSRMYTTVHQFPDKPTMPVLRLVVAAAYRLPFVTQTVHDVGVYRRGVLQADLAHFADYTAVLAAGNGAMLEEVGRNLYAHLCEDFTFRRSIECAL